MELKSILATDCGSTTTKAILIEFVDGEYRLRYRGEAPTTVEAPFEDVTRGVLNAPSYLGLSVYLLILQSFHRSHHF